MALTTGAILGTLLGLAVGALAGAAYGRLLRRRRGAFLLIGAAALLVGGMTLVYAGFVRGLDALGGFGVGMAGGGLTGVKYGSARLAAWRSDLDDPEHEGR
jgi:hypothetical protein